MSEALVKIGVWQALFLSEIDCEPERRTSNLHNDFLPASAMS